MPEGFNKEAAGDLKVVYQFKITGSRDLTAHLKIEGGTGTFPEGAHERPDVIIKSPAQVWLSSSD